MMDKTVSGIRLDPYSETADINEGNNSWGKFGEAMKFRVINPVVVPRGQQTRK